MPVVPALSRAASDPIHAAIAAHERADAAVVALLRLASTKRAVRTRVGAARMRPPSR
jgi:hypothetical protein